MQTVFIAAWDNFPQLESWQKLENFSLLLAYEQLEAIVKEVYWLVMKKDENFRIKNEPTPFISNRLFCLLIVNLLAACNSIKNKIVVIHRYSIHNDFLKCALHE